MPYTLVGRRARQGKDKINKRYEQFLQCMGIAPSAGRIQASIYGVCTAMEQLYPGDAATHL